VFDYIQIYFSICCKYECWNVSRAAVET